MATIKFYLDHPFENGELKKKPVMIYAYVNFNRKNRIPVKTEVKILPKFWDSKKQRAKGKGAIEINLFLSRIEKEMFTEILSPEKHSLEEYKNIFKGIINPLNQTKKNSKVFFVDRIEDFLARFKLTLSDSRKRSIRSLKSLISKFDKELEVKDINSSLLDGFVSFLVENGNVNTTIKERIAQIKTVLADAQKDNINVDRTAVDYAFSAEGVDNYKLTWEELIKFKNTKTEGKIEEDVKWMSLFRALTGLRWGDMNSIQKESSSTKDNNYFLRLNIEKSRKAAMKQIHKDAFDILKKYNFSFPKYSLVTHLKYIVEICKRAGVNEEIILVRYSGSKRIEKKVKKYSLITSHSFRRTFGRKMYDEGMPIEEIRKLLNHSNVETTLRYIGVENKVAEATMIKILDKSGNTEKDQAAMDEQA